MANSLTSNITRKLARIFLEKFDADRVVTKSVNSQLLSGKFNPTSGSTVDFKRPHDYRVLDTAGGDISGETKDDITSGKATGTVQNYMTTATEWSNLEEAIQLDQLDEILAPMATRLVTQLELNLATFMYKNCGLSVGTPGTAIDAWSDVASAGSLMSSLGVPDDVPWNYAMNPFSCQNLSSVTNALASGSTRLVDSSWERAMISDNFAGMRVWKSNCLPSRTITTAADLAGALAANPTVTYAAAKDSMQQTWSVDGFTASATIKAGDILQVTGRYRASGSTRLPVFDATGAQILFQGIVLADVTLDTTGAGSVVVSGPAIYEANGAYNTTTAAVVDNDVVTILGTSAATVQPALFYHPQAFGVGTVKLPKLYSTDTVATTKDGFSIRISKYSDGDTNTQKVRFDLLPAFAAFNPMMAGQGFGIA